MELLRAPTVEGDVIELIRMAVREDMGAALVDRTVELAIPADLRIEGKIVARRAGVMCGGLLLEPILREYGRDLRFEILVEDGGRVAVNQAMARVWGNARAILSAERTLLNFLGPSFGDCDADGDLCGCDRGCACRGRRLSIRGRRRRGFGCWISMRCAVAGA